MTEDERMRSGKKTLREKGKMEVLEGGGNSCKVRDDWKEGGRERRT